MFRLLARQYQYILIDAGSQINSVAVAALYTADTMFLVANPDVPSVRNAQRLLDRVRQLGACGERVRILLNRAAEPYPIPPKQIEARARPSDSSHVPERLQDRLDRAQLRRPAGADRATATSRRSSTASRGGIVDPDVRGGAADSQTQPARHRAPGVHVVTHESDRTRLPHPASPVEPRPTAHRPPAGAAASSTWSCGPTCTASCSAA